MQPRIWYLPALGMAWRASKAGADELVRAEREVGPAGGDGDRRAAELLHVGRVLHVRRRAAGDVGAELDVLAEEARLRRGEPERVRLLLADLEVQVEPLQYSPSVF